MASSFPAEKLSALNFDEITARARFAAQLVIDQYRKDGGYQRDAVATLCEITSIEDPEKAGAGVNALFPNLIEKLNDSFEPQACALYDRVMAQLIDFYRRLPEAERLDKTLRGFGLFSENDLLKRRSQISDLKSQISNLKFQTVPPRKVIFLSRVTIGADVAITSVLIAKLREAWPASEFVFFGSRKLRELFGGDPQVRIREIAYERGGSVLSRLSSWIDVVRAVDDEHLGFEPGEIMVIDPDSRMTQLGLLPLLKDDNGYFFFESRGYRNPGDSRIGELASSWANHTFGLEGASFPFIALPMEIKKSGLKTIEGLRRGGSKHVVAISLGVGGNERKRISDTFEESLVESISNDSTIILDNGISSDERRQIDRITDRLRSMGKTVIEMNKENAAGILNRTTLKTDVLTWHGEIGFFAGLISASDEYIGYDSAGQHIAAALGIPTTTIFVNSNSPVFAERWRPYGRGVIDVVNIQK